MSEKWIDCPIRHYAFSLKSKTTDYTSGVYFGFVGGYCRLYSDFTTNHHMFTFGVDADGEDFSSSSDDGYRIIGANQFGGLAAVGSYQHTERGDDGSFTTTGGTHSTQIKVGLLVYEPLANTKYAVFIHGYQTGMDYEFGRDTLPSGEPIDPVWKAYLFKEIVFEPSEILGYEIGGKIMRFASKELKLPDAGTKFETEEDFFKTFAKTGYVENGGYLLFKEGVSDNEIPLDDQKFETPFSTTYNGANFFRVFDYTEKEN